MNRDMRERMAGMVEAILKNPKNDSQKGVSFEIVDELEKTMYSLAGRSVPFDDYKKIWKLYNSEGGHTIKQLATRFDLSAGTITAIVKDKYF
jgi:hypothetical protein